MTLEELEKIIVESFCGLNTQFLQQIEYYAYYSDNDKEELIQELERVFEKIKLKGIRELRVTPSKCEFCLPYANAYSFHDPTTGDFVIRYVISQESESFYRVESCHNKPLPEGLNGMPF